MIIRVEKAFAPDYSVPMRSLVLRLLALVAVMLMPFGMAAAPAAPVHHQVAMDMAAGHCSDEGTAPDSSGAPADCTMGCASALPAADLAVASSHPVSRSATQPAIEPILSGIDLEIATPPPRLS